MEQIRVILVDSSPVVIAGFRSFFEKHPRLSVAREAMSLTDIDGALASYPGCVCIVDWQMLSPEDTIRIAEKSRLICSGMPDSIEVRLNALRMGARGFVSRDQSPADVRRAILTVAGGQIWIGKTTAETVLHHELATTRPPSQFAARSSQLTNREKQVIHMACQGLKSRGIALALRISEPTVAHHLTSIYSKLEVKDRIGLIIYAYQHSLQLSEKQPVATDTFRALQIAGN
jgi:DNA-binding NarL/FixJ family response regulator